MQFVCISLITSEIGTFSILLDICIFFNSLLLYVVVAHLTFTSTMFSLDNGLAMPPPLGRAGLVTFNHCY